MRPAVAALVLLLCCLVVGRVDAYFSMRKDTIFSSLRPITPVITLDLPNMRPQTEETSSKPSIPSTPSTTSWYTTMSDTASYMFGAVTWLPSSMYQAARLQFRTSSWGESFCDLKVDNVTWPACPTCPPRTAPKKNLTEEALRRKIKRDQKAAELAADSNIE